MTEKPEWGSEELKHQVETLEFISRTHRALSDQRRKAELQAFYTTTTLFALVGAAPFTGKLHAPHDYYLAFKIGLCIFLGLVAILSSAFVCGIRATNRVNRKFAEQAEGKLTRMLGISVPEGTGRTVGKVHYWEVAMICLMAIAAGLSVTLFCR